MGIYYSSVSKQTRNIDGVDVAFSNFYGKAPSLFSNGPAVGRWEAFCTRASDAAADLRYHRPDVKYVVYAKSSELAQCSESVIAKWNGQNILDDSFWDNNSVGVVRRKGRGKYEIEWYPQKEEAA